MKRPSLEQDLGEGFAQPVHRSFERWAARSPEAPAVSGAGRSLSYGELNRAANRLAHLLLRQSLGLEGVVGTLFPRVPESVVAALAVLKAGGAYLPLDPAYPDDRLLFTLADAGAAALLVPRALAAGRPALAAAGAPLLVLEELRDQLQSLPDTDPAPAAGLENLAYVIYTSGSTGRPKGVEVEHRGLANLAAWHGAAYDVRPTDRATRLAGSAFDASVWEAWPYLAAGASLHLPDDELVLAPDRLAAWLAAEGITLSFLPTPLAEAVLREPFPSGAPLRALLTGGDRLHLRPRPGLPFALVNHYGPTECSVVATAGSVAPEGVDEGLPDIGRPIRGIAAYLATPEGDLAAPGGGGAPGAEGELLLGGAGLARGYRGRPDLTAERFVPDPFSGASGARLYRTGDRVRQEAGGELAFVGRVDFQVKIRGFRIELGEIEAALRLHPAVREAVVLAPALGERERRLVGYVVADEGEADGEELEVRLARWLGGRLPEYMVPAAWVRLDRFPLTPNGKVDRAALPAPALGRGERLAPATPTEELVASLFAEVLGLERVGADEDFFALGGHSLRATQVLSRLRTLRGIEVPARALFDRPTVAAFAAWLDEGEAAGAEGGGDEGWRIAPHPRPAGEGCELPASFGQRQLWLADQWGPRASVYNTPFAFELTGPLSVAALEAALAGLVARHEPLRTRFAEHDGEVYQVIERTLRLPLPQVDLAALPEAARAGASERLSAEEAVRPFDLGRGPVLRLLLLRLAPERHRLLVLLHHIVSDDWSVSLLAADLAAAYSHRVAGGPEPAPLPLQYADFSLWQRQWLRSGALERQLAWWRGHLRPPLPVLDLPADRPRPAQPSYRGARLRRSLSAPARAALRGLAARGASSSPFMVLFAAWEALLARYAGVSELVTATPIANRHRVEVENLLGLFVNPLVVRGDLDGDPTLPELVARAREELLGAYSHQDVPFELLVEELAGERDRSRGALADVFLIYANAPRPPASLAPGLGLAVRELEVGGAKVDLSLFLEEDGDGGVLGLWEYATDLFDEASIARMAAHFDALLVRGGEAPARPVSALPLLSAAEERELARLAAGPPGPAVPDTLLHRLFFAQAERTPEAVALVVGAERLTYAELAGRALALAARLRRLGVGPETGVALFLERGPHLVPAMLAVMAAGGFYVPVDPRYPEERIAFLLEDSGCRAVLSQGGLVERLPAGAPATVLLLDGPAGPAETEPGVSAVDGDPSNLAYLIYTSGSTGRPKAVAIAHRSAVAMVCWAREEFTPEERSGFLAATSITFDLSVFEIFVPLAWGGTVILAEDALALPTVNLAGEALPRPLADQIHARAGVERLYNLYGPSEDTTYSTWALVERGTDRAPRIGRPLPGSSAWVVDPHGQLQPLGVPGELWLAGIGLSRGYLHRPDLTAARFVPDPFGKEPGGRAYRTGDLVRMRPDGELDYLGRIDHQVKVRGFRIELGEVEQALAALPRVAAVAVLALAHAARGLELAAFVAGEPGGEPPAVAALREGLRKRLPDYMVPTRFRFLDALPLTPNGKVDRKALGRLGDEPEPSEAPAFVPPSGAVEEKVAAIFAAVLGLERVGAGDGFFEIGGNSIIAARVLARVRKAFEVEVELRDLFEDPTVRGLARRIEAELEREWSGHEVPLGAARRPLATAPLTFAQERLWFLDHLEPGSTLYNMPFVLRLAGPLSVPALAAAFTALVRRHEVLRTTYVAATEHPQQRIGAKASLPLALVDLATLDGEERQAEAERLALEEASRPFVLEREIPLRAHLLRLAPEEHRLLLTQHHIASDGRSLEVLLHDLQALYGAGLQGRAPRLPSLPIQYADFALWQRRRWSDAELAAAVERERTRLAGAPLLLELPADRPRGDGRRPRSAVHTTLLPAVASRRVEALAQAAGSTPFMVFLAALQLLLGRFSGADDLLVGSPTAGRTHRETEDLIGLFVNTLVLRGRLAPAAPFSALLAAVREDALSAFSSQELPFEKLVEALSPDRQLARNPIFQVLYVFQGRRVTDLELAPGLALSVDETLTGRAKLDLKLVIDRRDEGFGAFWEYSADLFEVGTVERLGAAYLRWVEQLSLRPETRLSEVSLLSESEQAALLAGQEPPESPAPPLLRSFAGWVERTPEAVAAEDEKESLSYRELDALAGRVAARLLPLLAAAGPEPVIAFCLPRSARFLAAILGAMKAGGAYLALDPEAPDERLELLLRDSQAAVLLGDGEARRRLGAAAPAFLDFATVEAATPASAAELPQDGPCRPAYLIYTSGSTGLPKGVLVERRHLAAYVAGVLERMDLPAPARYATVSTFAADLGHTSIFPALASGGTVVVVGQDRWLDPDALAAGFRARPVDVLKIVPSHLAALLAAEESGDLLPRRLLILGGEAAPGSLLLAVRALAPDCRVLNHYGPTETTVGVLAFPTWEAEAEAAAAPVVPLGRPLGDTRALVADAWGEPAPAGVPGELWIGGPQVSRGYLGRPGLTAERFVPDPFGRPGARLYRTGDRVRGRAGGTFEFLGRIDQQVKVRGHRIEPGEIEAALRSLGGVAEALVLVRRDLGPDPVLVAYWTAAPGPAASGPSAEELAQALRARLPEALVPAFFVALAAFPLTANGKVDRAALPPPGAAAGDGAAGEGRPLTPPEAAIAEVFARILGRDDIGPRSDFFQLGGHSLAATRAVIRLRRSLGIGLELRALFEHPTVERLARHLEEAGLAATEGDGPLAAGPRPALVPASLTQQRIWLLERLSPGSGLFNMPSRFRVEGDLSIPCLEAALAALAERHEALRTRFTVEDGLPVMVLDHPLPNPFLTVDLTGLPVGLAEGAFEAASQAMAVTPFAPETEPLLRTAAVLGRGEFGTEGRRELLLTLHHLISDGWSNGILASDLAALYRAAETGRPSPLAPLARQFADFALWQRRWLQGEALERQVEFWRRELGEELEPLDLPTDRPRQAAPSFAGCYETLDLDPALLRAAEELGRRHQATLFATLLAAFQLLLARQSGQEGFAVGVPVANRDRFDGEGIAGCFVNTLVVRSDVAGAGSFGDLVGRVRERVVSALGHQDVPLERLIEELSPDRDLARSPLFQVLFAAGGEGRQRLELGAASRLQLVPSHSQTAKLELLLNVRGDGGSAAIDVEYRRDLWEVDTVRVFLARYAVLLANAVASPDVPLADLSGLLPGEERQLSAWNGRPQPPGLDEEGPLLPGLPPGTAAAVACLLAPDGSLSPPGAAGVLHAGAALGEPLHPTGRRARWTAGGRLQLLDRPASAVLGAGRGGGGTAVAAPRTDVERAVAAIWEEVLGREGLGLRDSFWDLGGHSLLAAKVLARITKNFHVEMPFDSLFRRPALGDFALLLGEHLAAEELEEEEEDLPLVAR